VYSLVAVAMLGAAMAFRTVDGWLVFDMKKILKVGLFSVVTLAVLIVGWLSISLVWYPSFDELDLQRITLEADTILAKCEERSAGGQTMPVIEGDTPTIQSLVDEGGQHRCQDGLYLVLWRDYFITKAGLFIVESDKELPSWIEPFATHLGGRVYSWHGSA